VPGAGDGENAAENRPDARRPPERERDADEHRAERAGRLALRVHTFFRLEERDSENAHRVQPEHDPDRAGDLAQQPPPPEQEPAGRRRPRTERNEYDPATDHASE